MFVVLHIHATAAKTIFTARPKIRTSPSLLYPFLKSCPELLKVSVLGVEVIVLEAADGAKGTVFGWLGGSTVVRLVRVIVGIWLTEAVVLPKRVELTATVDEFKSEAGVMIVVLAFDIVRKGLAEVILGAGITVNEASGLVIVAAGVPLLMIVGPLLILVILVILVILLKLEKTTGGGIVVEQWYVVPSTGVNGVPQQDMVKVIIGVVTVVEVFETAEVRGGSLKASEVSLLASELFLMARDVSRVSKSWVKDLRKLWMSMVVCLHWSSQDVPVNRWACRS
jgi:hypothetical protein